MIKKILFGTTEFKIPYCAVEYYSMITGKNENDFIADLHELQFEFIGWDLCGKLLMVIDGINLGFILTDDIIDGVYANCIRGSEIFIAAFDNGVFVPVTILAKIEEDVICNK
jgi:hypothetical protein